MIGWLTERMRILFFISVAMLLCTNANATASLEREVAELKLKQAIELIVEGQQADATLNELIDKYQEFRLAYMIRADIFVARAGYQPLLSLEGAQNKTRVKDLLEEIRSRYHYNPQYIGKHPTALLHLSQAHKYVLLLDAKNSRLYLIENQDGIPQVIQDYYASHGLGGMRKREEGDKRTPTGIYRVTQYYADEKLPELYGEGAYTLNYPNRWERMKGYSGSGIWLHGVPRITYSRPPKTSRGCVVISNQNLKQIKKTANIISMPIILAEKVEWLAREDWQMRRNEMLSALKQWQEDWQSLNIERYLSHYSAEYTDAKMDYEKLLAVTRKNAKRKSFVKVNIANIDIMTYAHLPHPTVSVFFDQEYNSNNYKTAYRKQQLWRFEGNQWKIVYEGKA